MIQKFDFKQTSLEGAYLISPFFASDFRGGFLKDYNIETFRDNHIDLQLKEVFYTISKRGVIRAIHFQLDKQQPKLVRCVQGIIYDVIVDLRPESTSYGKWEAFELSAENMLSLYIPPFFGHGYLVIDDSIVSYKCGDVFFPAGDSGIAYNDPKLNISWPFDRIGGINKMIISEKDLHLMSFEDYTNLIKSSRA